MFGESSRRAYLSMRKVCSVHLRPVRGGVFGLYVDVFVGVVLHEFEQFFQQHDPLRVLFGADVQFTQVVVVVEVDAPPHARGADQGGVVEDDNSPVTGEPYIAFDAVDGKFERLFKRALCKFWVGSGKSPVGDDFWCGVVAHGPQATRPCARPRA